MQPLTRLKYMACSDFTTIAKVKTLGLEVLEGKFLPHITPIEPSAYLQEALRLGLPLILARGSEKARSECSILRPVIRDTDRAYNT